MKIVKILGVLVIVIILAAGAAGFALFGGLQSATAGPELDAGIDRVQAGFASAYVLDVGNGQFALIDAGSDNKGAALLQDLQTHHAGADNVIAVLLTHSHPDHIAALSLFPKAMVYATKREVPLAAGQEDYNGPMFKVMGERNATPFNVAQPVDDGQTFMVGNLQVTAYAVPGHTEGSAAYLVNGVLFVGDAIQFKSNGQVIGPSVIFSTDRAQGEASLKRLAQQVQPHTAEVKFIASGHTGTVAGIGALASY